MRCCWPQGRIAGRQPACKRIPDIASVYAAMGELEATQAYAFRSIDKALATDRLYIVPRLITLVL